MIDLGIKKYQLYCYRQRRILRKYLKKFETELDSQKKYNKALEIMGYALQYGTGYYTIPAIENYFLSMAKDIEDVKQDINKIPNSVLHVMTQAYQSGGHSRVVARWINSANKDQKHSVVILQQDKVVIPNDIKNAVEAHNGELYLPQIENLKERAIYLRNISYQYQYIVLHIHQNDPTAILAYGTDNFKTPIILFNHADHSYWCGSSIVDIVADLRNNDFCKKYRNINKKFLLRIPFELRDNLIHRTKEESRRRLGIPLDYKVVLTTGSARKYMPIGDVDFCSVVNEIISKFDKIICYGIGPTTSIGSWGERIRYPNFVALGSIKYGETYFDYVNSCDLYLNSIPIEGGTAIIDAIQFKKPVVSYAVLKTSLGNIISGVEVICSKHKLIHLSQKILKSNAFAKKYAENQYENVMKYHGIDNWSKNLMNLYLTADSLSHIVHKTNAVKSKIDDQCIMVTSWSKNFSSKKHRKIEARNKVLSFIKNILYKLFDSL